MALAQNAADAIDSGAYYLFNYVSTNRAPPQPIISRYVNIGPAVSLRGAVSRARSGVGHPVLTPSLGVVLLEGSLLGLPRGHVVVDDMVVGGRPTWGRGFSFGCVFRAIVK